jgi:hypothetical protein
MSAGEAEGRARSAGGAKRACCLISEMLEEAGFDRQKARRLKRQVLEGMILLCRWQLDRMDRPGPEEPSRAKKGPRKVAVE